ncbi:MAG: PAS domain S-box protein, partial [Deltaproteobacteria bacterium]
LFLFDRQGRIVAELPLGISRTGKDFSFRSYIKVTFATKAPHMSDPYVSSQNHHHPSIMMTAPILDNHGNIMAVLGGSIDLMQNNFLGDLSSRKIGKTGYLFLFNKNRVMISHPDPARIMKQDIPPGANPLLDRAISGFEGTDETVNSRGLHAVSTFKHLKTTNWIIGANYPVTEAFEPIKALDNIFIIILPLFSLATFWFTRRYLNHFTRPIIQLTRHVEELSQKNGNERLFQTESGDEFAVLGEAFNELIRESDLQRSKLESELDRYERADAQLLRQNKYLKALRETTLGLISRMDVAGLLQTIVTRAGNLVGTEHCYVYLKNAAGTEMEMVFQSGIYNRLRHFPIKPGEGIAGRIWSTGKLFHVDDYSRWEGRLPDPNRDVLKAMAGVPLKFGEEMVGVLGVAFVDEEVVLNDEQLELLGHFGELASLALENARLNDDSQRELAERIKAEAHLRKLSVAVEQSPVSIVITDTEGTIEYVNPYFSELTGYSLEEVLGLNPRVLKTGETGTDEYRRLWETILSGGEWRGEFHNRKKDGELYWEQAHISPIRDDSNCITHFIAIKEDITGHKQLESQLHHSQKMEAIGQLAGGIAHDFNNILTAIIGYASIMKLKLPEDSPLKKSAEQITLTAERGASLTQGLLAFSRKQATNPLVVDLNEVLNRVHQLLLRLISEDINLEIILLSQSLPVMADSVQIEQVLMNLATNARDALSMGGSIVIKAEAISIDSDFALARGFGQPGDYALLTFTDNGKGMDTEIVKHIFEPFYTTKELGKGTGLGLSIVYGIIKKHGGYITCLSKIGVGTSFHVYLPLLNELAPFEEKESKEIGLTDRGADVILMAEDNDIARDLAKEILEEFGYSVLEAGDGQEALDIFKDNLDRIDLVILDVIMPKLNGREVYDAVMAIDPSAKILFCSGYSKDVVISQGGLEQGMNYLAKPYTPKELLMKIREVLDYGH